jgi:hypothetical protein
MTCAEEASDELAAPSFQLGKVISKSLSIFFRNIIPFTLLTCTSVSPLLALLLAGISDTTPALLVLLLTALLMSLATAIIVHTTFQHMRGRSVRLAEAASRGLSSVFVLLGAIMIQTVGQPNGPLPLPPPLSLTGIVLMALWYAAMPVYVVENIGIYQSLKRCISLSKGFRGKILALFLLHRLMDVAGVEAVKIVSDKIWGRFVWVGLSVGFGVVLITIAYYYLRVVKEGVDVERIGAVFD